MSELALSTPRSFTSGAVVASGEVGDRGPDTGEPGVHLAPGECGQASRCEGGSVGIALLEGAPGRLDQDEHLVWGGAQLAQLLSDAVVAGERCLPVVAHPVQ